MNKQKGMGYIAGVDEAGRGPLAGPVMAAAVILDPAKPIAGLKDSKLLSPKQRDELYMEISEKAFCFAVGRADVVEIDKINILQATYLAMQRAIAGLKMIPILALIDGNTCPKLPCLARAIIKGDQTEPAISAASIMAKVTRDREMIEWDKEYPEYGFSQHKGYATKEHFLALEKYGPCDIHRRSFSPVASQLIELV